MTIGDKIFNMRKARGWSQEELADRVGVTRQAVGRWESNSAKPDADKIVDICDLFGVSADYLLRDKYAGEGEMATQPDSNPRIVHPPVVSALQILGSLSIVLSVIVFLALLVLSEVYPCVYVTMQRDYRDLVGYIMCNDLWWLVNLDVVALFGGIALLISRTPLRWIGAFVLSKLKAILSQLKILMNKQKKQKT